MTNIKRAGIAVLACILFTIADWNVSAEWVQPKGSTYCLDIPNGWKFFDSKPGSADSFVSPDGNLIFQVFTVKSDEVMTAVSLSRDYLQRLKTTGEPYQFDYYEYDAAFTEFAISIQGQSAGGYLGILIHDGETFVMLGFSFSQDGEAAYDYLTSCFDSFAISHERRHDRGFISILLESDVSFPSRRLVLWNGKSVSLQSGEDRQFYDQDFIEREARIVLRDEIDPMQAWKRYYRMIYRDNYSKLTAIGDVVVRISRSKDAVMTEMLTWFQDFEFTRRPDTLSDIIPPLETILTAGGDCDSRALGFITILDQAGYDCAFMVSSEYAHAMAAVRMEKPAGASVQSGEKTFTVIEMTAKVAPGMIASDMSDADKWLIIDMNEPPAIISVVTPD